MYLFLFTELLLFGGMFLLYSVFRYRYALDFHHAAENLSVVIGVVNTAVLLTSSLTMALSVVALQRGAAALIGNEALDTAALDALVRGAIHPVSVDA